jgi:hypothetical protein
MSSDLYRYDFCFWYTATFLAVNIALLCGLLWRLCTLRDASAARITGCGLNPDAVLAVLRPVLSL